MAQRSRLERMDRVRDKRKRVYTLAVVAAVVGVLAIGGIAYAMIRAVAPARDERALMPTSDETSGTLMSAAATSTVPVEVPVLVGMQIADAELLVTAAGLALVKVPTPPGETVAGTVLAQTPAAGEHVSPGTSIELIYADPTAVAAATTGASAASSASASGIVVCIDPGHQAAANTAQEPVGPGAAETKPKVTGGATGVVTRQAEHALALTLSLKIQERLERYGVTVVMTRTTAAVDISNAQRAQVANEAGADLFLRVHADSNTNADINGVSTLYPAGNDWVAPIRAESLRAASIIHNSMVASSGAKDRGVNARADLAGFNYATMPAVLVEVGFLSNPNDDKRLAEPGYQDQLADGIARGVLDYLGVTE